MRLLRSPQLYHTFLFTLLIFNLTDFCAYPVLGCSSLRAVRFSWIFFSPFTCYRSVGMSPIVSFITPVAACRRPFRTQLVRIICCELGCSLLPSNSLKHGFATSERRCVEWDINNAALEPINSQYWAVAFQLFVHGYLFAGSYCVSAQARRGPEFAYFLLE